MGLLKHDSSEDVGGVKRGTTRWTGGCLKMATEAVNPMMGDCCFVGGKKGLLNDDSREKVGCVKQERVRSFCIRWSLGGRRAAGKVRRDCLF